MDHRTLKTEINELIQHISSLFPPMEQKPLMFADKTNKRRVKIKSGTTTLQDMLDYLRLNIKYLLFDLEATRRENCYLRNMLDESGPVLEKEELRQYLAEEIIESHEGSNKKPEPIPCPYCGQPLRTPLARQCFNCHMDWHDPDKIIKHNVKEQ